MENGVTIEGVQYVFEATSFDVDCDECAFMDYCGASMICQAMHELLYSKQGYGIFKQLEPTK